MKRELIDFADTETAVVTIRSIAAALDDAVAERDVRRTKAIYGIMADAVAGTTRLIGRLWARPDGSARRHSLGSSAQFPPERWKDMSLRDILADLADLMLIDALEIEVASLKFPGARGAEQKRLQQEIARMRKALRGKIRNGKAWIQKYWPGAWTSQEEKNFRDYL